MKYRITVSPADGNVGDIPVELLVGVECDGYLLMCRREKTMLTISQNLKIIEIVSALAGNDDLMKAAQTAVIINDLKQRE